MSGNDESDGPRLRLVTSAEPLGPVDPEGAEVGPGDHFVLRLYIAGQTPKSLAAIANLKRLCEDHLKGCHSVEIVDLSKEPERAGADQILALPTLVRRLPPPLRRIIGTLADTERVLVGLNVRKSG